MKSPSDCVAVAVDGTGMALSSSGLMPSYKGPAMTALVAFPPCVVVALAACAFPCAARLAFALPCWMAPVRWVPPASGQRVVCQLGLIVTWRLVFADCQGSNFL
eukprot:UN3142